MRKTLTAICNITRLSCRKEKFLTQLKFTLCAHRFWDTIFHLHSIPICILQLSLCQSEQWKSLGTSSNCSCCIQVAYIPRQWIHVQSLKQTCPALVITLLIKDTAQMLSEPSFLCKHQWQFPDKLKWMIHITPITSHVQPTTAQTVKTKKSHITRIQITGDKCSQETWQKRKWFLCICWQNAFKPLPVNSCA
jgi:hypothetical protein